MRNRIKYLLPALLGGLLMLAGCENEILFDGGDFKSQLTLNALIDADSLNNRIYLSFTGKTQIVSAGQVVVEIRVNGELKETLESISEKNRISYVESTTRFCPNDFVRIDARTLDGKFHAWVEETVPVPVEILQIDTSAIKTNYINAYKSLRVKVRFVDPVGEKNYYRIVVEQKETLNGKDEDGRADQRFYTSNYFWPWEDLALTDGRPINNPEELDNELFDRVTNYYGVFDDSWFKDSEYTLSVQMQVFNNYYSFDDFTPETLDVDLTVRLLSITEAEYYYLTTLNIIDSDILEEYISDPIKIPSNVHGGTGMIGFSIGNGEEFSLVKDKEVEYYEYYK